MSHLFLYSLEEVGLEWVIPSSSHLEKDQVVGGFHHADYRQYVKLKIALFCLEMALWYPLILPIGFLGKTLVSWSLPRYSGISDSNVNSIWELGVKQI